MQILKNIHPWSCCFPQCHVCKHQSFAILFGENYTRRLDTRVDFFHWINSWGQFPLQWCFSFLHRNNNGQNQIFANCAMNVWYKTNVHILQHVVISHWYLGYKPCENASIKPQPRPAPASPASWTIAAWITTVGHPTTPRRRQRLISPPLNWYETRPKFPTRDGNNTWCRAQQ